jgi:hypothetical protein
MYPPALVSQDPGTVPGRVVSFIGMHIDNFPINVDNR